MKRFEIPLIVEIDAEDRDTADEIAIDIADSMEVTWGGFTKWINAVAVTTRDHNILDRLGIKYEGEEI